MKKLSTANQVVHGLWIGQELSCMELLTLHSFLHHGHTFHLWVYDDLLTEIPSGVVLQDASLILPRSMIFRYHNSNQFGHGKGSLAGFSDIFRYKLLYEKGGWWVDMDVTCLKPFTFTTPFVFRAHHFLPVIGNVLKCPPQSELMRLCYEEATRHVHSNNTDWFKPVQILNQHIEQSGLLKFRLKKDTHLDIWQFIEPFVHLPLSVPTIHSFFHWSNEVWRSQGLDKNTAIRNSTYERLLCQYKIAHKQKAMEESRTKLVSANIRRKIYTYVPPHLRNWYRKVRAGQG